MASDSYDVLILGGGNAGFGVTVELTNILGSPRSTASPRPRSVTSSTTIRPSPSDIKHML